ncbi:hypothetical protein GCM10022211_16770 [Sphingomonas humi]|uniref:Uncharacterized protein n=2 Tax=Sphingomonas humi TaxID=335630 RepID=A0ABP7S1J6_9SPHN
MRKLEVSLNGLCLASPGEVILRRNAFTGAAFEAELTLENETVILGPFIATELSSDSAVSEEATFAAKLLSAGPISLV